MELANLRDFYPGYTRDLLVELSDEVVEALRSDARYQQAYARRLRWNRAQYSLDADDGLAAYAVRNTADSPEAMLETIERRDALRRALRTLPETQRKRVVAHYLLGKSHAKIAQADGVSEAAVSQSITRGLRAMKKVLEVA